MAKKRIHQIAKELDLASADILHQAKELGIEVKTASSGLTEEEEELVKLALAPVEEEKVSVEDEKVSAEEVEQNDNESQEEIVELQEEEAVVDEGEVIELDEEVTAIAVRIAKIPSDLLALNKRSVHRAMEVMGVREGIRATAEIQALGFHQKSSKEYMKRFKDEGVSKTLSDRDKPFGDYREKDSK